MDQTIVDVTDLDSIASGDRVTLIGKQNGAEIGIGEFSDWDGTIPWETLCSVTKRVPRIYRTALGQGPSELATVGRKGRQPRLAP